MSKKKVQLGELTLGGEKIYIQSMLNTSASDIVGSVAQASVLEKAGCDIVRAAIPTLEDVRLIPAIKSTVKIPLVADIHFDHKIALAAVEAGVDVIDTAMSPFALGTSQPATEVMVETFKGTPYDTGFDQNLLAEIADYS